MRVLARLLLAGTVALFATAAPLAAAPSVDDGSGGTLLGGSEHEGTVTARLLSEADAIAPGTTFTVAVEIRMQPGWHTYWENGGDAGLPTTIDWVLPDGFTAGPIEWPVPHRYAEEGDVVTFGYADKVLLLTEITAPSDLPVGGRVPIDATVDWLQCKDICIPGGGEVSLRLPVESEIRPAAQAVLTAFGEARARHPQPISSLERVAVHVQQNPTRIAPGESGEIAVIFDGLDGFDLAHATFLPRPSEEIWMRDGEFRTDGKTLAVVVPVEVDASVEAGSAVLLPAVVEIGSVEHHEPWLLTFEVPVDVAPEGAVAVASTAPIFTGGKSFLEAAAAAPAAATGAAALLRYLLLAFLGGIILNVMPCVLPVISLKILGFVSQADEDPRKIFRLGLVFGAGVLFSFLVLASVVIGLQVAGERVGWGFQFQNPGFVAGLAVVVFTFALSLLGVFEVGGIAVSAGGGGGAGKEYADAFFHGILTTVLATPCTAPMLGTAIAFAFSQPPVIILAIFLTVAVGLALPYVLLSANPAWLRYVPRPGMWMNRFKQIMGFLMLGTLVWLLFVFGAQTGADGLTWLLAFLLVVGFAAWMHGSFLNLSSTRGRVMLVWAITLVAVGLAYKSFLHDRVFGREEIALDPGATLREHAEVTKGGIVWEPFSVDYLEESVASGRTVFIDFTADWCWTCKVNEKTVLADAEVEAAFRDHGVLTLKGDWTRKDPEITDILERHARAGVPFYAVYPAGRPDQVIVLPEIINKRLVIDSIEKAGPSSSGA